MTSWAGVWKVIDERRLALGLLKADLYRVSGVSETTFRKMAQNEPVKRREKRQAIATALHWTPDSIDRILDGQPPRSIDDMDELDSLRQMLAKFEERLRAVPYDDLFEGHSGDPAVADEFLAASV